MKLSTLPSHLDDVRFYPWAVNLDYEGFIESLDHCISNISDLVVELAKIQDELRLQTKNDQYMKVAIYRVWSVLISLERAFAAHLLATNLAPGCEIHPQIGTLHEKLCLASKILEPFVVERWAPQDPSAGNGNKEMECWKRALCKNFERPNMIEKVIESHILQA